MKKFLTLFLSVLLFTCSSDSSDDSDPQTCNTPTALSASNIDNTSADLSWSTSESSASFEIQYGVSGFTVDNGQGATSNSTSLSLSNLTEGTAYQFYVRANCGSGNVSDWSNAGNFTTTEDVVVQDCAEPQGLETFNITDNSAELSWSVPTESINSWRIEYGPAGFTLGNGTSVTTSNVFFTLNGLQADIQYDFYVQSICSSTNESSFAGPATFTTDPVCVAPEGLSLGNVTHCSVEFGFDTNGETAFEIEYGESGFALGSGTVINTSDNFNILTDLNPGTTYEIYVRANCGSEGFSDYSDALVVSTDALGFTGSYLLQQLTTVDPINGPFWSDGSVVTVTATSPTDRTFDSENFPLICANTFVPITFSLNCNEIVVVNEFASTCACTGNYLFGPATNNGSYNPEDDTEIDLVFTADITNDCGPSEQVVYRLIKQ